jgi:tetratricopeptide (TPR) repeat protein
MRGRSQLWLILALSTTFVAAGQAPTAPLSPTGIRLEPLAPTAEQSARIRRADEALASQPRNVDLLIQAALAREDVWRYVEAAELYGRAIDADPDDYRPYLGRAHRILRLRQFDRALADLNRAAELDPYGFNTAYLRGLVLYLRGEFGRAADEYGRCMALAGDPKALALAKQGRVPGDPRHCMLVATDDPTRVAITAWRYRALRRAGRNDEAAMLLGTIQDGLTIPSQPDTRAYASSVIKPDDNTHYYLLLLFYRGLRTEAELLDRQKFGAQWSTAAYGVAVWHLVEGRRDRGLALLREIVAEPYWARLGHVAAETDLVRLGGEP